MIEGSTSRSNDQWIIDLKAQGYQQKEALSHLYHSLRHGLKKYFLSTRGLDENLFDDCIQEALIKILKHLPQYEGRSQFTTWATSIAIRECLNLIRSKEWKNVSMSALTSEELSPYKGQEIEPLPYTRLRIKEVEDIINRTLTRRQRVALIAELKGMPMVEIAAQLGSNRNAVYKLTHDARKRIKQEMQKNMAESWRFSDLSKERVPYATQ